MASHLRRRADRRDWYVHPGMLEDLLAEDGVVVGGARASGRLRDSRPVDAYVAADVLDRLLDRYVPDQNASEPNLIVRVVSAPWPFAHGERQAWPEVAAVDLLERGEDARARRVAHELLSRCLSRSRPLTGRPVDGEQANVHLWPFLGLLAERLPSGWVLIGGQMVLLHGMEHGQLPPRETNDADALVDVRVAPRGTAELASALTDMGWIPPARTLRVPAGTRCSTPPPPGDARLPLPGQVDWIPRPDLVMAIVGKAAALTLVDPQRHAEDPAFLCGLVPDPRPIDDAATRSDHRLLMGAQALLDEDRVWAYAADPDRARSTLTCLLAQADHPR